MQDCIRVAMVIYSVIVHQEHLFLCGDSQRTIMQLVGSRGASRRVRLVERSICRVVNDICCCFCKTNEEKAEFSIHCPASLGELLLVRLEAPPPSTSGWYCSKVVVTTPEGEVLLFPCYRFVGCGSSLALRDSTAKLVFNDVRPIELDQRTNELMQRRQTYRWRCYDDRLPETMSGNDVTSLPAEVHFSASKTVHMVLTVSRALVELGLQSFLFSQRWSGFPQIHRLCQKTGTPISRLVEHLWMEDWFFGYQFLNGANPTLIRRCNEVPPTLAVTEETVAASMEGGASLREEMERGNIFLVDYRLLDGLPGNIVDGKQNYLTAPIVLLHMNSRNQLLPIAIQLKQSPGETNPVFVPQDLEADWLTAKTFVRSADFSDHELRSHFLRTHVMSELFAVAALRNLPTVHPLHKLLVPHFRYTLEIDALARELLLSDGGSLKEYTAVGGATTLQFLRRASAALTYQDLCLPDDISGRGMGSVPGYYYRDDGLRLWDTIHRYVEGVVSFYYPGDCDVIRDSELQSWINEIIVFGRLGNQSKGFPQSFASVSELTHFITMVIFTASAQHAAVNDSQLDYFGWMPNAPLGLQCPPPASKGRCSERSLLDCLPGVHATVHGLATVYLLSKKPADFVPLGSSTQQLFTEAIPLEAAARFRGDLKRLSCDIRARNVGLKLPYAYLDPAAVEDSVTR